MLDAVYQVAIFTRGAGAYAYSYAGPPGLAPGQAVAVVFRARIELGVVVEAGGADFSAELLQLVPLQLQGAAEWGGLLLMLSALSASAVHEIAGSMLLGKGQAAIKLQLGVKLPDKLDPALLQAAGQLGGVLTPGKRALLVRPEMWRHTAQAAAVGAVELIATITGTGEEARTHPRWRKWYAVDAQTQRLWGIAEPHYPALPGSYLAGLAEAADYAAWSTVPAPQPPSLPGAGATPALSWEDLHWPPLWDLCTKWPQVAGLPVRRSFASWAMLRTNAGLVAEVAAGVTAGDNLLVLTPQAWLADRLLLQLAPWAGRAMRYRPEGGASGAAHLMRQLATQPGQAVIGGPGAWKLVLYGGFQRVIVVDPSHPQYAPERYPGLDTRLALVLVLAQHAAYATAAGRQPPRLDLVELGLSAWDGRGVLQQVRLYAQHTPMPEPPRSGAVADVNPLPLELRQPDRKRLVYFNRLGSSRGLRCMECHSSVVCPRCNSARVFYSAEQRGYSCPQCGFTTRELRCAVCGMAGLAAQLPGLEALALRETDYVIQGKRANKPLNPEYGTVLGTSQLLEPVSGFWPQEIVYVHAGARVAQLDDWPQALDMAARLTALYNNPQLEHTCIVSDKLHGQLGTEVTAEQLAEEWRMEMDLRRLAGLPPYGCIYQLQVIARTLEAAAGAREALGKALQPLPETRLLRLGRVYKDQGRHCLAGLLINPQLEPQVLQRLRWTLHKAHAALFFTALRGPWL